MRTSVKTLAAGSLAAASLLIVPAAIAAETDGSAATVAVTSGSLDVTAADVALGTVATSHTSTPVPGSFALTVDDTTGTGAGWDITQQVTAFGYTGVNGGEDISAANFSVTSVDNLASTAGEDTTGITTAGEAIGDLSTPKTVLAAAADAGEGAYAADVAVNLTVPAGSRAGDYTATLTTTAAPAIDIVG